GVAFPHDLLRAGIRHVYPVPAPDTPGEVAQASFGSWSPSLVPPRWTVLGRERGEIHVPNPVVRDCGDGVWLALLPHILTVRSSPHSHSPISHGCLRNRLYR